MSVASIVKYVCDVRLVLTKLRMPVSVSAISDVCMCCYNECANTEVVQQQQCTVGVFPKNKCLDAYVCHFDTAFHEHASFKNRFKQMSQGH